MNRKQLEHLIRAASTIAEDDEIIIVGSQAILGTHPNAPDELLISNEADLYPKNRPELSDVIDGSIGELSPFHQAFGYYAQGVAEETATLPSGWQQRLVPINTPGTRGATGWCISVPDLVVSKYVAGREKDREYVRATLAHGLVDADELIALLAMTPLDTKHRELLVTLVRADAKAVASPR